MCNLLSGHWWMTATVADVKAELARDSNVHQTEPHGRQRGWTPLHYLCVHCVINPEASLQELVNAGAPVTARSFIGGHTPLTKACESFHEGRHLLIEPLLKAGAKVNDGGDWGYTALHFAGWPLVVETLIKFGADLNARNQSGQTPLHCAIRWHTEEIISRLLEAGADVNLQDDEGQSPLHSAAKNCEPDILKILLSNGADVNIVDSNGKNVWDYAKNNENLKGSEFHKRAKAAKLNSLVNRLFGVND